MNPPPPPVALTIAGSDCSAGAGLQADLKTFSAHGVYGLTVVTCIVSEVPGRVSQIKAAETSMVRDQLEILLGSFPINALKTGMLYSAEIIRVVVQNTHDLRFVRTRHRLCKLVVVYEDEPCAGRSQKIAL